MAKTLLSFLTKMMVLGGLLLIGAGGAMGQSEGDLSFVGSKAGRSTSHINVRAQIPTKQTIQFVDAWWQVNSFTAKDNNPGWKSAGMTIPADMIGLFTNLYSDSIVVSPIIDGPEGWRALSSPTQAISFEDWLGDFWVQGITGSDNPEAEATILIWDEEGGYFSNPQDMHEFTEPGKGYIIYFWKDDNPKEDGIQGGFPKDISLESYPDQHVMDVPVSATDANENGTIDGYEGFNLLGNPFGSKLSVAALKGALGKINDNMNAHLYRWNPEFGNGNGSIEPINGRDLIAPYEAFWVRYLDPNVNGLVRIDSSSLVKENEQEVYNLSSRSEGSFELHLAGKEWFDVYQLEFNEEGTLGKDPLDGYKLFSLNPNSINLYSTIGNGNRLALNTLPNTLEQRLEVPLSFLTPDRQKLSFSWDRPDRIPDHWDIFLTDQHMDRKINMRTANSYSFQLVENEADLGSATTKEKLRNTAEVNATSEGRFALVIQPSKNIIGNVGNASPESISLNPNFPNPFTTNTTIPFELVEKTDVKLTIWNMIGQKVATLVDGIREAGEHDDVRWNAYNMPSGMYIARLEAGNEVFTRKMTLIK